MAIKINNTTVIDDSRGFIPVTISAGSTTGSANQVLKSTGVGVTWSAPSSAAGGGTNQVFFENDSTVTSSYILTSNRNAVSAGPITINSGVTVTIPSGSNWVIV